ncbi:hypothetical protein GCM10010193_67210 [Kitasatospora atroaurantiaca]
MSCDGKVHSPAAAIPSGDQCTSDEEGEGVGVAAYAGVAARPPITPSATDAATALRYVPNDTCLPL